MELQQSTLYAEYIKELNWKVVTLDAVNIFIKHIPFYGGLAKIQRPSKLPTINRIVKLLKDHRVKTLAVEPVHTQNQTKYSRWLMKLRKYVKINRDPFIPSKTIIVDLKNTEEEIFRRFSEAKRRAVRRAVKHKVFVKESKDIKDLIQIKNKSSGLFGFITTYGIDKMWNFFAPKHAAILLARSGRVIASDRMERSNLYRLLRRYTPRNDNTIIGGVLLIFWQKTAYYWVAGATKKGKKLFAPTLLVWEALKIAQKRGCTTFDFVGVYDERLPAYSKNWKGFTKFKEGFGGKVIYYPLSIQERTDL